MSGNIVTSEVRFAFVNLFKPRKATEAGKPDKYGVTLLFPNPTKLSGAALDDYNRCINALKSEAQRVASEKWGAQLPKGLRTPFRDQADKAGDYEGYEAGAIFLNVTSQNKPEVVDEQVQAVIEPSKVYSGCYGRVSVRAFAYDTNGNKGVSFGLQNVQKLRDGEPLGGGGPASKDFQPIGPAPGAAPATDATKLFN